MAVCSRCGCKFDKEDLNFFTSADVSKVPEKMCLSCLESAYNAGEEGLFYDTCENCGKEFDVFEEESFYNSHIDGDIGIGFDGWGRILCGACALEERAEMLDDPEMYSGGESD